MISQDASNSWRRLSRMVGGLQYRVANQRLDVLHKVSRALAEGCDVVGIAIGSLNVRCLTERSERRC